MYTKHLMIAIALLYVVGYAPAQPAVTQKDSLYVGEKNPALGFQSGYVLFIPKGTPLNQKTVLLVEPNNTGKLSDSASVHLKAAVFLASKSSVGNNVSTELKIPLLVPLFSRPESRPNLYTHALDRDVMLDKTLEFKRLDLQLLAMIDDSKRILKSMHVETEDQFFMSGFSASATFTNRFSLIHPQKIKALAIGGFNGVLMLPQPTINGINLPYPIGTYDFENLFQHSFDTISFRAIPQFIYMGALDENDAVQFDDAYSKKERLLINTHLGATVQKRYPVCQNVYVNNKINAHFTTYETVGHWTTSAMNLAVIRFFMSQLQTGLK